MLWTHKPLCDYFIYLLLFISTMLTNHMRMKKVEEKLFSDLHSPWNKQTHHKDADLKWTLHFVQLLTCKPSHKGLLMHRLNLKKKKVLCVDFLYSALFRQINTVSGNHDGGDAYRRQWRKVDCVTTGGFHVKLQRLISDYMSPHVLYNPLYGSYCCPQCLEDSAELEKGKVGSFIFWKPVICSF